MVHLFDEYYFDTDERNYILYKEMDIKETHNTKKENIGKKKLVRRGYYTTVKGMLETIAQEKGLDVLRETDGIVELGVKLEQLEALCKQMESVLNIKKLEA